MIEKRAVIRVWKDDEVCELGDLIKSMEYHQAAGEGDAHYVDCYFKDGTMLRIFRPDTVLFAKEN